MPRPNKQRTIHAEERAIARIKELRQSLGWSAGTLAQKANELGCAIDGSAIWKCENGTPRRRLLVDELIAISQAFGLTPSDLLAPDPWSVELAVKVTHG